MYVKQAANVLDLVEFFARTRRPATLSEIAQHFAWPRSSTFNILGTLVDRGYLYETKPRGGYYPTPRWLAMAHKIADAEPLPPSLHHFLTDLARDTGETVHVAAPAGLNAVFIDVVEADSAIRYFAEIGKRLPIHATATGRAILAQYEPSERQALLARVRFERYQPTTPMNADAVEAEIARSTERGWFQGAAEFTPEALGVAVPMKLADRPLSLAIAGPTFRMEARLPELGAMLRTAVGAYLEAAG